MKICYIRPVEPTLYEKAFNEICTLKDKKVVKLITIGMCLLMNYGYVLAEEVSKEADKQQVNPINTLGNSAIDIFQTTLTIIAIIMALFETGKAMLEGDPKRIPSIVAKYGVGVICIYAIPYGYFKIKEAFDGWKVF